MGYTTTFEGKFKLNKKLSEELYIFLCYFNKAVKSKKNIEGYGVDGEFYVFDNIDDDEDDYENYYKDEDEDKNHPTTQPGFRCQWVPTPNRRGIKWDGQEKFDDYIEWIHYIINSILSHYGYILNGTVYWKGEDKNDIGSIKITNNEVYIKNSFHKDYVLFTSDTKYSRFELTKKIKRKLLSTYHGIEDFNDHLYYIDNSGYQIQRIKLDSFSKRIWYHKYHEDESDLERDEEDDKNKFPDSIINFYDNETVKDESWYKNGLLHNDHDEPAVVEYDEDENIIREKWYQNGKLHRINDLPSIIEYK